MPGKHPIFLIHQADSVANETLGDPFLSRHIGPNPDEVQQMLGELGYTTMESFIGDVVPSNIRIQRELNIGKGISEREVLLELKELSRKNKTFRQFIGMGYADCMTPSVILRNIMENPGWYTQYTPYQAEISQGRLEALLNFQTMIADLTGLPISNASLLDEATASAEAMHMAYAIVGAKDEKRRLFFVSESCHPQTIAVVETRAKPLGIQVVVGDHRTVQFDERILGALVSYPDTNGVIENYADFTEKVKKADGLLVVAADLLSLLLLNPPGEWGADIIVGSAQRFGVPLGYGGPHAAYLSTKDEYKRKIPGRIVGLSKDAEGRPAIRLALQTREQHIRREKATSNICTAQVLLAVMASMYAVYHGPKGLKKIAARVHTMTCRLKRGLKQLGLDVLDRPFFDTLKIPLDAGIAQQVINGAVNRQMNFRLFADSSIGISLDETTTKADLRAILSVFKDVLEKNSAKKLSFSIDNNGVISEIPPSFVRKSSCLTHPVFNTHHSETEMMRYIRRLETRDMSLTTSMISLGSCTMKLNAVTEMMPVTWNGFSKLHPFVPVDQAPGYREMNTQLEDWLKSYRPEELFD